MNPIEELLIKTQMVDKELSALKITVQNLSHEVEKKEQEFQKITHQKAALADSMEKEKIRVSNLISNLDETLNQISWHEEIESIQLAQCQSLISSLRAKAISYIAGTSECVDECIRTAEQCFRNFKHFPEDLKFLEELQLNRREIGEIISSFLSGNEDLASAICCSIENEQDRILEVPSLTSEVIAHDFYDLSTNDDMDQLFAASKTPATSFVFNNTNSIGNTPWYREFRKRKSTEQGDR